MRKNKDLAMFKKLSQEEQVEQIKLFISTLPKESQEKATKDLLG